VYGRPWLEIRANGRGEAGRKAREFGSNCIFLIFTVVGSVFVLLEFPEDGAANPLPFAAAR
jgi:hypothetical protein